MPLQEYAKAHNIPAATLHYWIAKGGMPAIYRGGSWWLDPHIVARFRAECVEERPTYRLRKNWVQ